MSRYLLVLEAINSRYQFACVRLPVEHPAPSTLHSPLVTVQLQVTLFCTVSSKLHPTVRADKELLLCMFHPDMLRHPARLPELPVELCGAPPHWTAKDSLVLGLNMYHQGGCCCVRDVKKKPRHPKGQPGPWPALVQSIGTNSF